MTTRSRVVVLGLDGATFNLIKRWAAEGRLPTFARLLAEGAHADLTSTLPALTPPAWTSAATGKNPGKHNIFNFYKVSEGGLGPAAAHPRRSPQSPGVGHRATSMANAPAWCTCRSPIRPRRSTASWSPES